MSPELIQTNHVPCPKCEGPTYGPYLEPATNEFFEGFYCENCGLTWYWNKERKQLES